MPRGWVLLYLLFVSSRAGASLRKVTAKWFQMSCGDVGHGARGQTSPTEIQKVANLHAPYSCAPQLSPSPLQLSTVYWPMEDGSREGGASWQSGNRKVQQTFKPTDTKDTLRGKKFWFHQLLLFSELHVQITRFINAMDMYIISVWSLWNFETMTIFYPIYRCICICFPWACTYIHI